jgi:hypothetical protein
MKTVICFLCFLLSFSFFSCQKAAQKDTPETNGKAGVGYSDVISNTVSTNGNDTDLGSGPVLGNDTILVNGRSVVFFSISQDEYDRVVEDEDSGMDEVLDDFNYYSSVAKDQLEKAGYKTIFTISKTFALENSNRVRSYFTRDTQKGKVGVLLFDGKNEPLLNYGVLTDIDYLLMVEEYFKKE